MLSKMLIATDGSPLSIVALEKALEFAKNTGAKATILTVMEPIHVLSSKPEQLSSIRPEYERHAREKAAGILADAEHKAKVQGVPYEALTVENEHPYRAIIDIAKEKGCDLIAMASHGRRGVSALVLGSDTVKVLTHSTIPVLVYR